MASTDTSTKPSPASKLTEEAMDLVCSFVREEQDDCVMNKTLLCLSLVSRSWTSSAVRALLFDPTRSLSNSNEAWMFLHKLIRRPGLGKYVHALEGLARVADSLYPDGFYERSRAEELQVQSWLLTVFYNCQSLASLTLAPEIVDSSEFWKEELGRLEQLQHLKVVATDAEVQTEDETVVHLLANLGDLSLESLVLEDFCLGDPFDQEAEERCEIKVKELHLDGVCLHVQDSASAHIFLAPHLQHVHLRPHDMTEGTADFLLVPSLLSFVLEPTGKAKSPPNRLGPHYLEKLGQLHFPFDAIPFLPVLTDLTLRNVLLSLHHLTTISTQMPSLEDLVLRGSTWKPEEWLADANPEDAVTAAVNRLPSLERLHLGWVPVVSDFELFFVKNACKKRGIKLKYKRSLVRREAKETEE